MNDLSSLTSVDNTPRSQKRLPRMPSHNLLGIRLHAMTKHDLVDVAVHATNSRTQCVIGNHNLHSLYFWSLEPKMRAFYAVADYINIDGMSLVYLGRLLGLPVNAAHRTNYIDLLPLLAVEASRRHWRFFYLGSRPGVAARAAQVLRTRYPGLQIAARDGYFDTSQSGEDNQRVLSEIRAYDPDILMVGMGMPRQESWIEENLKCISASAIFCCGGLMDLVAGEIPTAPRWLGPLGLEWLYRLLSDPARVWRRYLIEPWVILFRVTKHYVRSGHLRITEEHYP